VNNWEAEWNATAIMKYGQRKSRPKRKTALEEKHDSMTTRFNALTKDGWTEQRSRSRHECGFSLMVSVIKSVHLIISLN